MPMLFSSLPDKLLSVVLPDVTAPVTFTGANRASQPARRLLHTSSASNATGSSLSLKYASPVYPHSAER